MQDIMYLCNVKTTKKHYNIKVEHDKKIQKLCKKYGMSQSCVINKLLDNILKCEITKQNT